MKKLILILVSIVAVAGIAFGTATAMSQLMPSKPQSTSVDVDTMPEVAKETPIDEPVKTLPGDVATDTQIKNDINLIATNLETYKANNRDRYPTTGAETIVFENTYLKELVHPVTRKRYSISAAAGSDFTPVSYLVGFKCMNNETMVTGTTNREFAIMTTLTTGKNYCVDNSTATETTN